MTAVDLPLAGLARAVTKLMLSMVKQGALDRELTLRDLKAFQQTLGQDAPDQMMRVWIARMIDALRSDPSRGDNRGNGHATCRSELGP